MTDYEKVKKILFVLEIFNNRLKKAQLLDADLINYHEEARELSFQLFKSTITESDP